MRTNSRFKVLPQFNHILHSCIPKVAKQSIYTWYKSFIPKGTYVTVDFFLAFIIVSTIKSHMIELIAGLVYYRYLIDVPFSCFCVRSRAAELGNYQTSLEARRR